MPSEASDRLSAKDLRAISAHAVTRSYPKHTIIAKKLPQGW
jgi:hypothetical protein